MFVYSTKRYMAGRDLWIDLVEHERKARCVVGTTSDADRVFSPSACENATFMQ